MNKKNRILIIGAGGALGRTLMDLLNNRGECYLPLVKHSHKDIKNSIKCDIRDFNSVNKIIYKFKPTHVIHLAGITGNYECEENSKEAFQTNVFGTFNVLKSCLEIKPKIIFSSSREVYGNSRSKVNEKSKLNPINVNGITKMMSEDLILNYNKLYKIPYCIIRFTNFYGENFSKRGISKMIKIALQNKKITVFGGKQEIDLIHFNDAAKGLLNVIDSKKAGIYNIGSGESKTILELIHEIEKFSKKKIKFNRKKNRTFEVRNFKMDISKAKKDLGFKPSIKFQDVLNQIPDKSMSK
ncbi:NAD(P)-dependent oxidoreductase [Nitrosopumilus sp. b3]|uniref:NAD-dependent epimerase/dehydratase family protein n=1 Tax=Nitrosopumilus sp. b3 TaxID=2109909 RepID=UPI0015F640F7|nr:NAD(P)-dependent oxidoreductase [Nitrosopumilus sp. b3]